MPLATPDDVAAWLMRPLTDAETTAAEDFFIPDLEAQLRIRIPGLDARIAVDDDFAVVVRGRIASTITAFLSLPKDGSSTETVGGITRRWDTARSAGFVGLTAADWAMLVPTTGLGGAYVVPLGG